MLQRAQEIRTAVSRTSSWPAPSQGWVQSGNIVLAPKQQAEVLDNFIPTAQGIRLRGGASEYADIGASVVRLMTYSSGGAEDFWASTATGLYDATRVNGTGTTATYADVEGLTSGDWSATQIGTSGGQFLVAVNGTDLAMYWDGADWNPINGATVNEIPFDAETGSFTVGETVTGGTSGASATILAIVKTGATAGFLRVGAVTSGPFQDNEALTDAAAGAATAAGANASSSTVTITGVATSSLSQVWLFKRRLFFVEKNTTSAWYLPVDSIGGAATEFDLGAVFRKGGSLLFGATWSLDAGDGLDDICLFVSDQGEVAVYEGTDPSSASTWALSGVYDIGVPLDKHAWFRTGGDLAIMTEGGIIPASEALRKDRAALQTVAVSYPIEDAWKSAIQQRTTSYPISATLWQSGALLLIGTPETYRGRNVSFIANAQTGAWARVTGWDVRCAGVFGDELYFGNSSGKVLKADSGGNDDGVGYTAVWVPKFEPSDFLRTVNAAGITYRATEELQGDLDAHADYTVRSIDEPATTTTTSTGTWGTGVWGTFVWGAEGQLETFTSWQAAYSNGYALAPSVAVTVNQSSAVRFQPVVLRLRTETGYAF